MGIASEGYPHLAVSVFAAALATALGGWWSLPFWGAAVFVAQFFREPARAITPEEGAFFSPADGRIVFVGEEENLHGGGRALKISVFMNVFNAHANRIPAAGEIVKSEHFAGKFFNAALHKSSRDNERHLIVIRLDGGEEISCVQVAGLVARRISCDVREGEKVACGQRYGFIRFGSRVDLYLPTTAVPAAAIGDKVYAGLNILARLPSEGGAA